MNTADFAFDQEIELFLATCRTASLATVDDNGQPHAANIQYAHSANWRLHWISSPTSAHSQHLAANPRAAVTIYAHQDTPELIHGLQLRGRVDHIISRDQPDWDRVWDVYTAKFPFVNSVPKMRAAAENQYFYVFRPTWLRWIDNRKGFGWKIEKGLES